MAELANRFTEVLAQNEAPLLKSVHGPGDLWPLMRQEAEEKAAEEPILGSYRGHDIISMPPCVCKAF